MSKRLQVVMPDDEYAALAKAASERNTPISDLVRKTIRETVATPAEPTPAQRMAAFLRYARFSGPTGDIEQILDEIEQGRDL